jgi:hypothetical protein
MPTPKRLADGRFKDFIQRQDSASDGKYPFIHITRGYEFDAIVRGDTIDVRPCTVFKENLIYLFYGRPAYRAKDGNNARLEFEWPIIFIFNPEKIIGIKRIFPFDTGAFELGLYQEFFHPDSKIEDFEVDPTTESAAKLVGTFYVDHREYYQGRTRKNVDIPLRQFEAEGVFELCKLPGVQGQKGERTRDERSSAIEIQLSQPITLKDSLIAIVLPEPYLADTLTQEAIARWNVTEVHGYPTLHNMGGEAWVGQVYGIVYRIFQKLGFPK